MSFYVLYPLYPFTSILHLFGVSQEWFLTILFLFFLWCFIFIFLYFTFLFPFTLTRCLWFDLHRHLFLLVLFLLCGCVYNQEMEMQKSTCCHSKYVLFHLAHHLPTYPSPPRLCLIIDPFLAWLQ